MKYLTLNWHYKKDLDTWELRGNKSSLVLAELRFFKHSFDTGVSGAQGSYFVIVLGISTGRGYVQASEAKKFAEKLLGVEDNLEKKISFK